MKDQLKADGVLHDHCYGMQALEEDVPICSLGVMSGDGGQNKPDAMMCTGKYKDDISGQVLVDILVQAARKTELDYFASKGVWIKRPRSEARDMTGKGPISVRWVDVNKGDDIHPKYRSRLVARQLKAHDKSGESYFSPAPPLEALRTVVSLAFTAVGDWEPNHDPNSPQRTQVSTLDISRAYFNAMKDADDVTFVDLPPEDSDHQNMCARLLRHMYGTRGAADGWQEEYSTTLVALGFAQGTSSACVFAHKTRQLFCSVHGDDFTTVGPCDELTWFEGEMQKRYELTLGARLGPGRDDAQEVTVLNRVLRWTPQGIEYEADPRQAEKLVAECGLTGSNSVATPGVKESSSQVSEDTALEERLQTPYRSTAARANYLAADRPDIQYSAKEICRWMSSPTTASANALKRLVRYLVGLPRLVLAYPRQRVEAIDVYVDTDWAGCPRTRRSTSGGCLMMGGHLLKSWSSTQAGVALSSGEAEFNGVIKGAGIGLGYQSLLNDLGLSLPLRVWTDSSAAIGICSRQGLGKLRHLDTHLLWIQQAVRSRRVDLRKISGEANPADLYTKHLASREKLATMVRLCGCRYLGGRSEAAPSMRTTTTGKTTIAEANAIHDDHNNNDDGHVHEDERVCMPHLEHDAATLDRLYPSVSMPQPAYVDDEEQWQTWDHLEARGNAIIKGIQDRMTETGRKRCDTNTAR